MKRKKKIISAVLGICMLSVSLGAALPEKVLAKETQEIEKTADAKAVSPVRLSLGDGQTAPKYKAGQDGISLKVKVTNKGNAAVQNVRVTPVIDNASDWPFEIGEWNYEKDLGTIEAGKDGTVSFDQLKVRQDVESKSYGLKFQVSCDDGSQEYQMEKLLYVTTTAAPKEDPAPSQDGGNSAAGSSDSNGSDAGAGADLSAMSGGDVYNSEPVATGGSASTSVPRVIVEGFRTEPGDVNAGSDFKLIIKVKNTSKSTAVSNMLFDLQAPASGTEAAAEAPAFLPASGGSSIYLEKIPANQTKEISIQLNARADLVQKPYSIDMSMKYEDGNGGQYEASSSLAIPVKQAARFEFSELQISPSSIAVGEEANITCNLYNTGRTKLYNVKAKFEGEGISGQDVFVGNVESGATGTIDGMINGDTERSMDQPCKMIVTYEDEAGNESKVEQEFNMEVTAAVDDTAMPMEEENQSKGLPIVPILILILVVVVVVVAIVITKRKKKKRAQLEEEDLMDEVDRFTEDE